MPNLIGLYRTTYLDTNTQQYTYILTLRPPLQHIPNMVRFIPIHDTISENKRNRCLQIAWDPTTNSPVDADNYLAFINNLIIHASFEIDTSITQLLKDVVTHDLSELIVVGRVP